MPISLTPRLDDDEEFRKKLLKVIQDYVQNSRFTLDYYTSDFDAVHDILMCYATLTKQDYVKLAKGHPRRYILPITATHVHTMTSYLTQTLFGDASPHKVDPGTPESEAAARVMNGLLEWNAEQQPPGIFQLGWFWVENSLTYNRGITYDCYQSIYKWQWSQDPVLEDDGTPVFEDDGVTPKTEFKKVKKRVGGFGRVEIVSPYDFYIDQNMPLYRMQEGRFAGHRVNLPWNDLQRRSKLPEDDPQYLSPRGVKDLKLKPAKSLGYPTPGTITGGTGMELVSRTAYERTRINTPLDSKYDSKDAGVVSVVELWVRLIPKDYEIDDREEPTMYQIIMGNEREILAMNESVYEHDMFPYSVMEARPSPFYQYSPSWVMILKPIQEYVDYLKNRHMDAVTRTVGNVFLAKAHLIDIQDFEDPDKEGKFINILPEAGSLPISEIIRQVPVVDTTAGFIGEMQVFINFAESTTGATQGLQGNLSNSDTTATAFQGSLAHAQGRLTAIARLMSVQGIVPQTKRLVSNFQQFYDGSLIRRITGEGLLDMSSGQLETIEITPDTIQGEFDYRPHDGTLPGPDARSVAALTRAIESMQTFPAMFQPGKTNINPKHIFIDLFRKSGAKPEKYRWSDAEIQEAQQQIQAQMQAAAAQAEQAQKLKDSGIKPSLAVSAKLEMLNPPERAQIMAKIGVSEPIPGMLLPPQPGQQPSGPLAAPGSPPPIKPVTPPANGIASAHRASGRRPGPPNQGGPRSGPMIPALAGAGPLQPRPV